MPTFCINFSYVGIRWLKRCSLTGPLENISSLMKYQGLRYPTHIFKIAGCGIGDNFLEHSLKQTNIFARRIVSQTLHATNKAKRIFNRPI